VAGVRPHRGHSKGCKTTTDGQFELSAGEAPAAAIGDRDAPQHVIADANPSGINLDIGGEVRLAEGPDDRHDAEQQTGQANRHSLHPAESHPEGHHHQPGRDCHPADRGDRQQCSPNRLHPDRKGAQSFGRRA